MPVRRYQVFKALPGGSAAHPANQYAPTELACGLLQPCCMTNGNGPTSESNGESRQPTASVLIAIDFSPSSDAAALQGFRTATLWGSMPHVLHVCGKGNDLLAIDTGEERLLLTPDKARAFVASHVEQLLKRYRQTYGEPGFDVAMSHIAVGDPGDSIVDMAKELRVSLIVVGTSKQHGVARVLLGSTAEKVVRHATCGVLVSHDREPGPEELIEPARPDCLSVRQRSEGAQIWCQRHSEHRERRHTYHYRDKNSRVRGNLPLLFPMSR